MWHPYPRSCSAPIRATSTCACVIWLIQMCDMPHSYVWQDSIISTQMIYMCGTIHMCDVPHSYVWHDSFMRVDTTHLYAWHATLICAKWLIHMCWMSIIYECNMTHSYVNTISRSNQISTYPFYLSDMWIWGSFGSIQGSFEMI